MPLDTTEIMERAREARQRHGANWDHDATEAERDRATLLREVADLGWDRRALAERVERQNQAAEWIRTIAGGGGPLPSNWATPWRERTEKAEQQAETRLVFIKTALDLLNGGTVDVAMEVLRSAIKAAHRPRETGEEASNG
ncbi:hypothetical protein GCM10023196_036270 [Actinoallomurus vinaceus]|uniref:DUF222 domain-containing protein n=1 Tax=Actinoallomurus vinaceus TaxID=1080074 RepID=A0ABP8U918_9ACTN